ncbi:MAG: hypothetical protein K0Q48_3137 [Bacillota bacterium]|jgi:sensor histidine kinase YesM|nr:hypothetical protein [Bacillota bacterium]
MHLIRKKIFLIIMAAFLMLTMTGCNRIHTAPRPESGALNMKNWNFADSGIVALDGAWDFYWNQLLTYQDLKDKEQTVHVRVPETWDNYKIDQEFLPGTGVATYRLRVNTNLPEGAILALRLKTVSSAYRLFINDQFLIGAGTIGTAAEEEKGEYNPQTAVFRVPDKQFDIIIQVSNFQYARGGLWDSLYLGDANQIHRYENMLTGRETLLLGVLMIISFFYLAIFFQRKELKYTLYFSLLCMAAAISVDTAGEFLLINSSIPFRAVVSMWYGATGWMTFFLLMFMHELFPSRFSEIASKVYFGIIVVLQFIYITVTPSWYTRYAFFSNFSETVSILVSLLIILIGARKNYKNWLLNAISVVILFIGYLHDILYLTSNVDSPVKEIFYWSALSALVLQMTMQAQRIKTYFDNKAAAELLLLQAQIKPHFLYNTINTIISVSRTDTEKSRTLLIDFSEYLRRSFDFKGSDQLVSLSDEIELAKAYIAIEKARFGNRLNVSFHIRGEIEQIKVPILVLQPIIENAIIHGILPKIEGGSVDINIRRDLDKLFFSVRDDGVGISEKNLRTVLEQKGSHIGLSNIDSRLRRLYKRGLEIESKENHGTEVKWCTLIRVGGR